MEVRRLTQKAGAMLVRVPHSREDSTHPLWGTAYKIEHYFVFTTLTVTCTRIH